MTTTTEESAGSIGGELFSEEAAYVYAVLDGASVPGLVARLYELRPEFECLHRGELAPDMAEVAPYLVRLEPESDFADWALGGWGRHWGVFAAADADLRAMRRHFRSFVVVYTADGKPRYFRFYDPRVLRVYLPTCNAAELETVFGPVACYVLEDEDPHTLLRFSRAGGALRSQRRRLASGGVGEGGLT